MKKTVYEKSEVEAILKIVLEETEVAIDKAFNEGYKQGLLQAKPDAEYFKILSEELQKENARLNSWKAVPWWSVPVCVASGFFVGLGFAQIGK